MKKLSVIVLLIVALVSCAKKITNTKVVTKPNVKEEVVAASVKVNTANLTRESINTSKALSGEGVNPKENKIISEGKEIYEVKCSRCHELKSPSNYNAEKWIKIVDWMGPRAKIDATEKESILAYVSFYAKK